MGVDIIACTARCFIIISASCKRVAPRVRGAVRHAGRSWVSTGPGVGQGAPGMIYHRALFAL